MLLVWKRAVEDVRLRPIRVHMVQTYDIDAEFMQPRRHFFRRRLVGKVRARHHVDADEPNALPFFIIEMPVTRRDKAIAAGGSRVQLAILVMRRRGIVPRQRPRKPLRFRRLRSTHRKHQQKRDQSNQTIFIIHGNFLLRIRAIKQHS